jgi:hypothetical protein
MSTSSPGLVPAFTLETEVSQVATSSSAAVQALGIEGEINSENGAHLTFRRHIHLNRL